MNKIISVVVLIVGPIVLAEPALAIEECSGGNRAARHVTCIVDGDTGWHRGTKWRMLDIDAPETFGAQCDRERAIGDKAKRRLIALMSRGYQLANNGEKDRTSDRRNLVRVILSDGQDAGKVLIREGLAQPWPNKGNRWCNLKDK